MRTGSVSLFTPAVKKVIRKSSNDNVKDKSAPLTTAGRSRGNVTRQNVFQGVAPRSDAASSKRGSIPFKRARMINVTYDTENVVWAKITEKSPRLISKNTNHTRS